MSVVQAIILGIVQGLTEFLPISSSAHLLILPWLFEWPASGITFDVLIHGGTLLAVIVYFWTDLKEFTEELFDYFRDGRQGTPPELFWPLLLGTLPAVLVGGLLSGWIEEHLRIPLVVVITLTSFGALLWVAERWGGGGRLWNSLRPLDGLLIGAAQALALMPGVSRSGVTITAALLLGLSRVDSARFSFLLAVPIIGLATLLKLGQWVVAPPAESVAFAPLAAGVVFSFLSGFLCVKFFLQFLQTKTFLAFALYRFLLAAFICYWLVL